MLSKWIICTNTTESRNYKIIQRVQILRSKIIFTKTSNCSLFGLFLSTDLWYVCINCSRRPMEWWMKCDSLNIPQVGRTSFLKLTLLVKATPRNCVLFINSPCNNSSDLSVFLYASLHNACNIAYDINVSGLVLLRYVSLLINNTFAWQVCTFPTQSNAKSSPLFAIMNLWHLLFSVFNF